MYIISIPIANPAIVDVFIKVFLFWLLVWDIQEAMEYTTWKIAPAPTDKNIIAARGEYRNPPIHAPAIVGAPAINPITISFRIMTCQLLATGN